MGFIRTSDSIVDIVEDGEKFRYIQLFLQEAKRIINGNLLLDRNFKYNYVTVNFLSADTDLEVPHNLGRAPTGYIVTDRTAAMIVYSSTIPATPTVINLKASAVGTVKILFL